VGCCYGSEMGRLMVTMMVVMTMMLNVDLGEERRRRSHGVTAGGGMG